MNKNFKIILEEERAIVISTSKIGTAQDYINL